MKALGTGDNALTFEWILWADSFQLILQKDISILARSGYDYDVSKRVLEIPKSEFNKFFKMI